MSKSWRFEWSRGLVLALGLACATPSLAQTATDLTTYYVYDEMHRVTFKVGPDPDGAGTGQPRRVEKYQYDEEGRVLVQQTGTGAAADGSDFVAKAELTVSFAYDAVGNKIRQTSAVGVTQISYDGVNRAECAAVRMAASTIANPPADACVQGAPADNPAGPDRISKNTYDAAGQLIQIERGRGGGLTQAYVEKASFTLNGQVQSKTDANNNTSSFVYDGFDRLQELQFPAKALAMQTANPLDKESYLYDENGNRKRLTKRGGQVFDFTHDALDRETFKDGPGTALDVTTEYDLLGNVKSVSWPGSSVTSLYDKANRRVSETTTAGSSALQVSSRYDAAGNRTRVVWGPDNGAVFAAYDYYYDGGLKQITGAAGETLGSYSYDSIGRPVSASAGNGVTSAYQFRGDNGLLEWIHHDGFASAAKIWQTFSYNAAGQILTREQSNPNLVWTGQPSATTALNYNGLNQNNAVASVTSTCSAAGAGYDCNGNLKLDVETATSATRSFDYDAENRLTQVIKTAGGATTTLALAYDPTGRLLTTTAGGVVTRYLYDGDQLVGEYDGAGNRLRRYVHGPGTDDPLVWFEGGADTNPRWLHVDRQGSVVGYSLSDKSLATYAYGPYGEAQSWAGSRFRYTGQIALPEVELYYYKARVYDPRTGRFLQTDPIGYKDDLNLYAYVAGDPMNKTDPTGECGVFVAQCIGAGVGVVIELGFQLADSKVRADYARAGSALARGDIRGAADAAGKHAWGVVAAAGAGALGAGVGGAVEVQLAKTIIGKGGAAVIGSAVGGGVSGGGQAAATGGNVKNGVVFGAAAGGAGRFLGRTLESDVAGKIASRVPSTGLQIFPGKVQGAAASGAGAGADIGSQTLGEGLKRAYEAKRQ